MNVILGVLLVLAASPAQAQSPVRCTDAAGKTTYSDRPCPANSTAAQVRINDNTADFSFERKEAERNKNLQDAEAAYAMAVRPSIECDQAIARYRAMFNSRNGPNSSEAKRLTPIGLSLTPEAVEVRAKCGEGAVPMPNGPINGVRSPLRTTHGVYKPTSGGYISPKGEFCRPVTGGLHCPSGFVRFFSQ